MYCSRHHIFVGHGDACPVCLNDLDQPGAPLVHTIAALEPAAHHPEWYRPGSDAEYQERQRRDEETERAFWDRFAEAASCLLCEAPRTLTSLRDCLPRLCQCGERAGAHAIQHPHPHRLVGCAAFQEATSQMG